jgi:hypothetical protein
MATNFLSYSNLTYDEIMQQITTKITSDPRFQNFSDSQISALIIQILAATCDFSNFLMDSSFNESFFQTAKLKSSIIGLSRNLGYAITRPISAIAKMKVKLFGNFIGLVNEGENIQIPYHQSFSYGDSSYVLKDSLYITITSQMFTAMQAQGSDYSEIISVDYKGSDIVIVEGILKEKIITGDSNPLVAQLFQMYKITDTTFSNFFGNTDFTNEMTQVYCGVGKDRKYTIDKRSVINWENFTQADFNASNPICVIRTGGDGGVEVLFGDGVFADIGAKTTAESVWISYLSSQGSKGNKTGLIGEVLNFSGTVYSSSNVDVSDKVEFQFKTNPTGGADLESIDSIKMNAPSIYYSLDRLVTAKDYTNYLKSLTTPIAVKNALAWGEQSEIEKHNPVLTSDIKMFNVVMFTVLGSLYNVDVSPYTPRETNTNLNLAVLDSDYDEDDIPIRGYFNIYMRQNQIDQFLEYTTSASYWNYLGSATAATDTLAGAWLLASYGSTAPLSANYTSTENENTIIGTSAFTIDMSSIGSFSSLSAAMNYIASEITTKLQTIIDQRGLIATNPSKGLQALPTVQCYYDTTNLRLATSASSDDPCYLYGLTGSFMNDLGLSGKTATMDLKTSTDYISQNIITVREAIQDRSQITTQSIYLSPIIHTFNLSGTVYVNPLYDIATIKTEVEDALYSFYDLNADFNSAIHISELVDIIKNNNGVKFCDVGFQTVYPSRSDGQSYVAVELAKPIYTGYWSTLPGYSLIVLYLQLIANSVAGYQNQLDFTERYLMDLLKQLTDLFYSLFPLYFDSNDYLNFCSAVRKDNLRYIRDHLKNPYGNLGEGIIQSDGSTLYDFSVGSEIIKIRNTLTYSYKG